jgi:hypothetical protein
MSQLAKLSHSTIIPSRSKYQIERFVVNQHDTPQMQFQQILIEGADLTYKIKLAEINIEKTKIEISRLKNTGDEIDALEAEEKELGLNYTRLTLEGAKYELAVLEELFAKYPMYSYSDIEENQPEYWSLRLNRQAELDIAERREGISSGNLASMLNAGLIERKLELEGNDEIRNLEG